MGCGSNSAVTSNPTTRRSPPLRYAKPSRRAASPACTWTPPPVDLEVFPDDCPPGRPSRHLDVRFRATAPAASQPVRSDESLDLAWFDITDLPAPLGLAVRRSIHRATLHLHAR